MKRIKDKSKLSFPSLCYDFKNPTSIYFLKIHFYDGLLIDALMTYKLQLLKQVNF